MAAPDTEARLCGLSTRASLGQQNARRADVLSRNGERGSRWNAKLSTRQIETFRFFDYDIYTMGQAVIFHIDRPG